MQGERGSDQANLTYTPNPMKRKFLFDQAKADQETFKIAEREAKKEKILEETKQNLTITVEQVND